MAFQSKAYTVIFLSITIFSILLVVLFASLANHTNSRPKTGPLFFEDMDQARRFHRECLDANGVVKSQGTVYGVELTCYGAELTPR